MTLEISPTMALPDEWVSHRSALLAMSGAGKSNGVVVIAEAMYDVGLPFTIVDPKGDVYGIRSSADGKAPGLSIPIFGGLHGDVPLEPTAGAYIADLIFDHDLTCLLDVSQFSKGEMVRFLAEFGERLYRRHQAERKPRHVFIEEAEEPIAQSFSTKTDGGYMARCVGAWNKIAKLGRAFGLGVTMATQRSAGLNKNALTQVESLIILRTAGPQDLAAIKGWLQSHGAALTKEILDSLPSLGNGEAWMVSPHVLGKVERFTFRRRRTFDSGATPKLGEKPAKMTTLAEVDFAAIKDAMAETIERAKADDPKELRKRIAELERHRCLEPATVEPQVVEIPILDDATRALVEQVTERWTTAHEQAVDVVRTLRDALARIGASDGRTDVPRTRAASDGPRPVARPRAQERSDPPVRREPRRPPVPGTAPAQGVGKGERVILAAVAQYPDGVTPEQLTVLTGYKRSSRNTYLQRLKQTACVTTDAGRIIATDTGITTLGDDFQPLPTGAALREHWLTTLPAGEARILAELLAAYPSAISSEELSERTGYLRSSRNTYLQRLRSRRLVTTDDGAPRAADALFEG